MRWHGMSRWFLVVSLVIGPMWAAQSVALAGNSTQYKQQAAQFRKMLDKQASSPGAQAAAKDIEQARTWLDNAEVLLAKDNQEAAAKYLRRVEFSLDLIKALVGEAKIRQAADEQQQAFQRAKQQRVPDLQADIEELKNAKQKLNRKLERLR